MGLFKDTYNISHTTVAPSYPQTIHEHKAPTDDSMKLLREMEEAARQSVLDVYQFEDNFISGIVVLMKARTGVDDRTIYIRFTLNGRLVEFQEKLDIRVVMFDKRRAYELLMKGVRDAILERLIPHMQTALIND